jgi:short-subunit dehydrogenase
MKTAIITGASIGLGLEFVRSVEDFFPDVECVWLISRSRGPLEEAAGLLKRAQAKVLPLDLCDVGSFDTLAAALKEEQPEVTLLINNAGCGYLGNIGETELEQQTRMADLNVRAFTAVTHLTVPYMAKGGRIINISSIASFCPNPRMTVYSSTKAFVSSFSRGLGVELKERGITATAVCPGPMATEFLDTGNITGRSKTFDILPYCDPKKVAKGSLAAACKGRVVYTPKAFYKFYRFLAKILPQCLMIKFTKT